MKRLFLCLILVAAGAAAQAQTAPATPRTISVTGEGRVEAVPDMATITLGVTRENADAGQAMSQVSDAVAQVLDRLAALGIAPRDTQTRNITLNPIWSQQNPSLGEGQKITGYAASNTVEVRVRALDQLGDVLAAVVEDGANTFNGLGFSLQEPQPLMDEARRRAVRDARARAALLAEEAGVVLGEVRQITDMPGSRPVMMEMAAMRTSAVPVAAGEVSVTANISMVFAIADAPD